MLKKRKQKQLKEPFYWLNSLYSQRGHLLIAALFVPVLPSQAALLLFDSTVVHGLGFTHSFAGYFKGSPLVGGDTLVIGAQIWLHLLPNLLLGVQLFVWFT